MREFSVVVILGTVICCMLMFCEVGIPCIYRTKLYGYISFITTSSNL